MKVFDKAKAAEIIKTLADDQSRKILSSTIVSPLSVEKISDRNDIPVGSCYRKIHSLRTKGMLKANLIMTKDRKRAYTYQSNIKYVMISFRSGELGVKLSKNRF